MKPLCIDLFCGLGGWADGFLAEGYDVIGFDIERHSYPERIGGTDEFPETRMSRYPGQLVLQDVLTLDGRQFRNAAVIVASPPCQAYSYRAMPFGALWAEHNRMDDDGGPPGNYQGKDPIFNDLFRACFRIAREARLPIIIENVKGAQKFLGRANWHHGSFYLWGDIPALMPITLAQRKGCGGTWFTSQDSPDTRGQVGNPVSVPSGIKVTGRLYSSRSDSRKAASAQIAKIPFPLAQHIARVFKP